MCLALLERASEYREPLVVTVLELVKLLTEHHLSPVRVGVLTVYQVSIVADQNSCENGDSTHPYAP